MVKKNACIFISGFGSNLKSLIRSSRDPVFPIKINLVIINLIPIFKKTLEYQFVLDQGLMREHREYLHMY